MFHFFITFSSFLIEVGVSLFLLVLTIPVLLLTLSFSFAKKGFSLYKTSTEQSFKLRIAPSISYFKQSSVGLFLSVCILFLLKIIFLS